MRRVESIRSELPYRTPVLGAPEVWGGVECTFNRVHDRCFDQQELSGHVWRVDDYDRIASVGIKTLRVGLVWERHQQDLEWQQADVHMLRIQQRGIRPIVGLVHHGSGPLDTSLLDPKFPERLAQYAGELAERYPWVELYTPINEPNTTARFSGYYGVWYPHHQSKRSYLVALLNQLKATVLSMRAIRKIRPDAQLFQTEDLGRIWSTNELAATCDLLNERRWLTFDLLFGLVDRTHSLYRYLVDAGLSEYDILWFKEHPCPPDIIGINYYLTSDRYIDHRVELYSENRRSSEGRFVDIEAVRIRPEGIAGFDTLLREAWERYGTPIVLSEVHVGSEVEEQIRWAAEAWNSAVQAREQGIPCVAVTFWALFGSFYWNTLVTSDKGEYEAGVFDLVDGRPLETALAKIVRQMVRGEVIRHPALANPGWWRENSRICYDDPGKCLTMHSSEEFTPFAQPA